MPPDPRKVIWATHKVVIDADNEDAAIELLQRLTIAGIRAIREAHYLIRLPDGSTTIDVERFSG